MKSPKAPPAPNPQQTATAQADANRQSAITQYGLQATNQQTPYGSLSYNQIGTWEDGTPRFEATQSLSPEQQGLYNQSVQMGSGLFGLGQQQLQGLQGRQPFSLSGLPEVGAVDSGGDITRSYGTDFSQDRQRVEDALLGRLNTQLDRDRGSLEQRLANQGVALGSEAWQNAMSDHSRSQQDARTSAILGAGQEQSRLAGLERDRASFQNAAQGQQFGQNLARGEFDMARRGQGVEEQLLERNQPLQEYMATSGLLGLGSQSPNYVNTPAPGIAPTDVLGAESLAYGGAMNNFGAQNQRYGGLLSGLFGLGSAALGGGLGQKWFS